MDRYELRVREEEIRKLAGNGDYVEAVKIADTVDWSSNKSVKMLCLVSDLYKANRRYQESKEILLMAYEKYPTNKRIIYSLCDLSIRLEEYVQAIEYYKEYAKVAPRDTNRYILQYRIYQAQDVSLEERARVLEEYKARDPKPKWCYELAYLYHSMGLGSKCIDECDDLIVTFGEGKYVIKAMELKALHEPLSSSEQRQYEEYIASRDEKIISGEPLSASEDVTSDLSNSNLDDDDLRGAPTSELPTEEDIQVKPVDVGQYNTVNLQAALAESMKDLWGDHDREKKITPSRPEPGLDDNTIFEASPLAAMPGITPVSEQVFIPEEPEEASPAQTYASGQSYITASSQVSGLNPGQVFVHRQDDPVTPVQTYDHGTMEPAQTYDNDVIEPAPAPRKKELSPLLKAPEPKVEPQQSMAEKLLQEQTKRIPTEQIVNYVETKRLVKEIQVSSAQLQASAEQAQKIPGASTGQLDQDAITAGMYDQMLAEEYNGQIRLAIAEADKIEKQITGQLSIDDVLADWEEVKKENEKKRDEEVRTRILQHTGSLFDEFDEETKKALLVQLEQAFKDAIIKNSDGRQIDEEKLGEKIHDEALRTVKSMTAVAEDMEEAEAAAVDTAEARVKAEADESSAAAADTTESQAKDEAGSAAVDTTESQVKDEADSVAADTTESQVKDEAGSAAVDITESQAKDTIDDNAGEKSDESEAQVKAAKDSATEESAGEKSEAPVDAKESEEAKKDESGTVTADTSESSEKAEADASDSAADQEKAEADSQAVNAVREALQEDEEERAARRNHKGAAAGQAKTHHASAYSHGGHDDDLKHILSEEEEELFAAYLDRKGARRQITKALENMSMAAYTGNVIVTGGEGVGTMDLAKRLIKYMQATDSNFLGNQVARVSGKNLNDKDMAQMLSQLNGGAIIIQNARGMKKSTVQKLISALENENLGILAILEDTSEGMDKIVGTLPKLGEIFNVRIDLQALDDKSLVDYACEYALSQEHSIDEFALLALHTRIAEMQTSAHQVTVSEVRDLVDDAIFYADKKNPAHLFDIILHKRYDDEDMVILREKDFMHY